MVSRKLAFTVVATVVSVISPLTTRAATGSSTGALGGGVVTVGSVGTNQMNAASDFTINTGDTLIIDGADPVSGGGNILGRKIIFEDNSTLQTNSYLRIDGDGTYSLRINATGVGATIYTNTGNLEITSNFDSAAGGILNKTGPGDFDIGPFVNPFAYQTGPNTFNILEGDFSGYLEINAPTRIINIANNTNIHSISYIFGQIDLTIGDNNTFTGFIGNTNGPNGQSVVIGSGNYLDSLGIIGAGSQAYNSFIQINGNNNSSNDVFLHQTDQADANSGLHLIGDHTLRQRYNYI
jgi:hypothetical protein